MQSPLVHVLEERNGKVQYVRNQELIDDIIADVTASFSGDGQRIVNHQVEVKPSGENAWRKDPEQTTEYHTKLKSAGLGIFRDSGNQDKIQLTAQVLLDPRDQLFRQLIIGDIINNNTDERHLK